MKNFIRYVFTTWLFILSIQLTNAQTYGNEWINYGQTYYKIPIVQKGIYRLSADELLKAGIPANIDPTTFQLFHRGKEQAIFVQGEEDKTLNTNDFMEFYAEKADGVLDSLMYYPTNAQPNPLVPLYSDTAVYFLTFKAGIKGKRMNFYQEENTTNLAKEAYHWNDQQLIFSEEFGPGQFLPVGSTTYSAVFYSHWDYGEGYVGSTRTRGVPASFNFNLPIFLKGVSNATLEVQMMGRFPTHHQVEVSVNGKPLGESQFDNYAKNVFTGSFGIKELVKDQITISTNSKGTEATDNYSLLNMTVSYPEQLFDIADLQKYFRLPINTKNKSFLSFGYTPQNAILYDITDLDNLQRIGFTQKDNFFNAIINGTNISRKLLLTNNRLSVQFPIKPLIFRNMNPEKANYLIITHPLLMKLAGGFTDAVRAYASYRASAVGGGYDTLVTTIDELYNQFNYGESSPTAFRKFAAFMAAKGKPQALFLIGQSRWPHRIKANPNRYNIDMVPNSGWPSSDMYLTMNLFPNRPLFTPEIPLGRLNADSPQVVIDYLNKVKEHESPQNEGLWRKNILHLSGGKSQGELTQFKEYVNGFQKIAQNANLVGVKVTTLSKQTDEPVEFINVTDRVNEGIGMITFFGHAGGDITDIDIGFCSNPLLGYNNKGKYPLIVVNGCDAGNFYYGNPTFGSDWINTPNKGGILFLAHTYAGYAFALKDYSDKLYEVAFGDSLLVGKSFGKIHQEAIRQYMAKSKNGEFDIANAEEIMLQGDPAVAIFPVSKTDYAIDNTALFLKNTNKQTADANSDSLRMGIIVSNLGRVGREKLSVSVKRTFANGTSIVFDKLSYNPVAYQDTLFFSFKNDKTNSIGTNKFDIILDPDNQIQELKKTNNAASFTVSFANRAATPLFPLEYGIVNLTEVNLITQATTNGNRAYLFELDTKTTFDSPTKKSFTVNAGLLPNLKTTLSTADSTVYYWRVRAADKPEGIDNQWASSSFTYIKNSSEGWSQSQQGQFDKITADNRLSLTDKGWIFQQFTAKITAIVSGNDVKQYSFNDNFLLLNGRQLFAEGICENDLLNAVAFGRNLAPYSVLPAKLCGGSPYATNALPDAEIQNEGLLAKYIDAIPAGNYVLLFTSGKINFEQWTQETRQKLTEIGADINLLNSLKGGQPYLIFGRKGSMKALIEKTAAANKVINLTDVTIQDAFDEGVLTSPIIGPASAWSEVFQQVKKTDNFQQNTLEVIGVNAVGVENSLLKNITTKSQKINTIDAKKYPYLRLKLTLKNTNFGIAPQLSQWLVTYKGVPEGVAFTNIATLPNKEEGEPTKINVSFKNLSSQAFADSILVKQIQANRTLRKQESSSFKVKKLAGLDSITVSIPVKTLGWGGENTLSLTFNPQVQIEQYYTNNSTEIAFNVVPDKTNPTLEVLFDGKQIANGEVVSPSPQIAMILRDENRFLTRTDTLGLDFFWQNCETCPTKRLNYKNNPNVQLITSPANASGSEYRVEYRPKNLPDGLYKLQVQGRDAVGNLAGLLPYSIGFKVVTTPSIQAFQVYPNPTASYVKFVISLSGVDIPDEFSLKIFTPLGVQVQEFTQSSTPLRIGTTEILWNVASELPAGNYLYKMVLKNKGVVIPFAKVGDLGVGKLIVLR